MGRTPDRFPGLREEEEGILVDPGTATPTRNGELRYVVGVGFRVYEEGVEKGLSGGIDPPQHEALSTLVHDVASDSWLEVIRDSNRVTSLIYWSDSGKTSKVRESIVSRDGNNRVYQVEDRQYSGGVLFEKVITTYTRDVNGRVVSADINKV